MSRKTQGRGSQKALTPEEIAKAARTMMIAALAHFRTADYCRSNPKAQLTGSEENPPNIDAMLFPAVAFELNLLSIEQSIKAILVFLIGSFPAHHNIHNLYNKLQRTSRDSDLMTKIYDEVNSICNKLKVPEITESNISECLRKHDSSYANFRYFSLDKGGRTSNKWEMKMYEIQVLSCLASALLNVGRDEMRKKGIGFSEELKPVSVTDIDDDLKELMARMKERSTR